MKVFIGMSFWFRESYGKPKLFGYQQLLLGIKKAKPKLTIEKLTELDEYWNEIIAVNYREGPKLILSQNFQFFVRTSVCSIFRPSKWTI